MMTDLLFAASTDKDLWHVEHQGPLIDIVAQVWRCGDEWCDCSQGQITARFRDLVDGRWIVPKVLWQGTFYTDGEPGANAELVAKRTELQESEPDMSANIRWFIVNEENDDE